MTDTPDEETASALARLEADLAETVPEGTKWSNALVDKKALRTALQHIAALTERAEGAEKSAEMVLTAAQWWHRQCQTIATIIGLGEPESDFAEHVRTRFDALTERLGQLEAGLTEIGWRTLIGHPDGPKIPNAGPHAYKARALLSPASAGQREGREDG